MRETGFIQGILGTEIGRVTDVIAIAGAVEFCAFGDLAGIALLAKFFEAGAGEAFFDGCFEGLFVGLAGYGLD